MSDLHTTHDGALLAEVTHFGGQQFEVDLVDRDTTCKSYFWSLVGIKDQDIDFVGRSEAETP